MNAVTSLFLYPLSPVISVVTAGCLVLLAESVSANSLKSLKRWLALLGPVAAILFTALILKDWPIDFSATGITEGAPWLKGFGQHFRLDQSSVVMIGGISVFTLISLILTGAYSPDREVDTEISSLVLFISSGMMLLVTANSLLMVFMALELLSLPTYVLVGIKRQDRYSTEAALKYFLFGSFATVFLVLGIALLYAQFGTLSIPKMSELLATETFAQSFSRVLVFGGLALLLISVLFKVGVAPFHMWVPDAYEGAPAPITGFMGSCIKLAGFGLVMRVLWGLFLPLAESWIPYISFLAVTTMFVGNLTAVLQDNLKRMFAYSSIAHAGYLLLSLAALPSQGMHSSALLYYLLVYGGMFVGLFACLAIFESRYRDTRIQQLSGLGFKAPWLGGSLAIFALSAAGIPPTAGFLAKYFIFMEVVRAGHTMSLVLAVISSAIAIYYYLRVLVYLYMKEAKSEVDVSAPRYVKATILTLAAAMIVFTFVPQWLGLGLSLR